MTATSAPRGLVAGPDFNPAVLNALYEQAFATPDVETAGILVGRPAGPGAATQITALIPAVRCPAPGQPALLTHRAWSYVHDTMGRYYATEEIVGWYLSRPDSTRMTVQDQATHRRFFSAPGQMALIFDSRERSGAIYSGGADGVPRILYEGPVTHDYRPAPSDTSIPWRGAVALGGIGLTLGSVLSLAASATGLI
jgi:hypothetical protein